jgi:serine/threonine protein kinase
VVAEGRYSKAADVYSFGVVLWELLTWQQPWETESVGSGSGADGGAPRGMNTFQIMTALAAGQRPTVPPEPLGALGAPADVAAFRSLLAECWAR